MVKQNIQYLLQHLQIKNNLTKSGNFYWININSINIMWISATISAGRSIFWKTTTKRLSKQVRNNESTIKYVKFSLNTITKYIKKYKGDIYQLLFDNEVSSYFQKNAVFPVFNNPFTGLMIAIHVTHENNIKIKNAQINNNVFSCTVEFDFFDRFGLNGEDLNNSLFGIKFVNLAGFRAWYYLQHSKNYEGKYKPFVTHAIFEEDLNFNL